MARTRNYHKLTKNERLQIRINDLEAERDGQIERANKIATECQLHEQALADARRALIAQAEIIRTLRHRVANWYALCGVAFSINVGLVALAIWALVN